MARLTYTTQNGKTVSLPLQADIRLTARLVWLSPLAGKGEQTLRAELAEMNIPRLASEGDHVIYDMPDGPLAMVVIRPHKASSTTRVRQKPASQTLVQDLDLGRIAMLIQRCRREWIVVTEDMRSIRIDKQPVPLLKILKDGMEIQLGDLTLIFNETDTEIVGEEIRQKLQNKNCPYCQSPFEMDEEVIRCPACGTLQHAECWNEYGGRCSGPTGCPYGVKTSGAQTASRSAA